MNKNWSLHTYYNLTSRKKIKTEFRTLLEAKEYISNLPEPVLQKMWKMKRTYLLLIKRHNSNGCDTSEVIININNGKVSFSRSQRYVML